ncbi:hypothetical protein PanWU01x14_238880 [Parasponia andersonii]|uniref:Uncharacterized protein n=1 Tax=Parasponia andersonii TaxID=3476 RepID=A0A2P5BHG5_PARAD|nr:hypothetical protein PanWU01x14_238880 [Parasponia andersonii]
MAANNYQWPSKHVNLRRAASVNELEVISSFITQVSVLTKNLESMMGMIDSMAIHRVYAMQSSAGACEQCFDNLLSSYCPLSMESAHFIGNQNQYQCYNPYSNSYNLRWRNHPNFLWSNQNQQG